MSAELFHPVGQELENIRFRRLVEIRCERRVYGGMNDGRGGYVERIATEVPNLVLSHKLTPEHDAGVVARAVLGLLLGSSRVRGGFAASAVLQPYRQSDPARFAAGTKLGEVAGPDDGTTSIDG
jgi:hypothetical protein